MSEDELVRIERLVQRKKGRPGEEIEVHLSDASSFFMALRIWQDHPVHEGDSLTTAELSGLRRDSERVAAKAHALSLLARAEHSEFLLGRKLVARGRNRDIVAEVLDSLRVDGVLDDRRYAESWLRDRMRRHPEGRPLLVAGLRSRGVSRETAEHAVEALLSERSEDQFETVCRLAERFSRSATPQKVRQKLLQRGFDWSVVEAVIRSELDRPDELEYPEE